MNVLIDRCMKRSNLVQELYESWYLVHQVAGQQATFATDVAELCEESIALCRLCKHTWETLWNQLFDVHVSNNVEIVGRSFRTILDRSIEVATKIRDSAARAEKKGQPIALAEQVVSSLTELEAVKDEFEEKWPFFDTKMSEEAHADFLRGDYITAEQALQEALNELQSGDLETLEPNDRPVRIDPKPESQVAGVHS